MFSRFSVWLALVGIVAAVFLVKRLRHEPPAPPPVAIPASSPFADSIGARGIVESVDENVRIAPAVPALVTKLNVKVGDHVKAGDVLLEQDSRDAAAMVTAQRAQLARLGAGIREAEVALAEREDQWARMEKLTENKVSSVEERQRVQFAVQAATTKLESARAELAYAQAQVARSEVQLDLLAIRAPREGTILQVNVRAGEYAGLNPNAEPVILLGQVNRFQLRADVDEDNASRVRPDCQAVAFIKGRRDHPIPLGFVRIEPYIVPKRSLTGESTERVDTRVLQIIFRFDLPQIPVYVGQQMDVFLDAAAAAL
jgi:RND family efflux transporter MFP subunit